MNGFNVTPTMFFAVLELALALLVVALGFIVRSSILAGKIAALQRMAGRKKQQSTVETVSFLQHLGDEVARNQALVADLDASEQSSERQAAGLLQLRGHFLQLEAEAQALADDAARFREKLTTGITTLVDELKEQVPVDADAPLPGEQEERSTINTEQAELESLRQVINNQQDALTALREELRAHSDHSDGSGEPGDTVDGLLIDDDGTGETPATAEARPVASTEGAA